jgi:hypothetical protein
LKGMEMFDIELLSNWFVGLLAWVLALLVLMILDSASGALRAWKVGYFNWEWVPKFLKTGVVFLWAWLTAEILAVMPGVLGVEIPNYADALADWGPKVVYGLVASKYVASIVTHFKFIQTLNLESPAPFPEE